MKKLKRTLLIGTGFMASVLIILGTVFNHLSENPTNIGKPPRIRSTSSPKASVEAKKARWEYFFNMLRDPATNEIPPNIRQRELAYARTLPKTDLTLTNRAGLLQFDWQEAGPNDVGGRTRALAVDVTNSNVIIAGGVSGGIWKSTDNGQSWLCKSDPSVNLSVTSVAQDPRPGHTNTWYYAAGECSGNSASDRGWRAFFSGDGMYKSNDNGESWQLISKTNSNPTYQDNYFDYISRVVVCPVTGYVYVASNLGAILVSKNQGTSFELLAGGAFEHNFTDVIVAPNGTLVVSLSQANSNNDVQSKVPGIYVSKNQGQTWTNITPNSFPQVHERSVLALAPSNPNILYVLTNTGNQLNNGRDDVRFHKTNILTGQTFDRTRNLPNIDNYQGYINTQGNYNMEVAVKPDDENFVIIGATSLFRSRDGFSSPATNYDNWIGGYLPSSSYDWRYPNLHPDQHVIFFDPDNPQKVWCGHDGGLSYAEDIGAAASLVTPLKWINKNNKYNVTQFYTVALPDEASDDRIMGGTQDNGTPFFRWDGSTTTASSDKSSGDGAHAYFAEQFAYTSVYYGKIKRLRYQTGDPSYEAGWSIIKPTDAEGELFINPFVIDPTDENIMYYPAGKRLWRNKQLSSIPDYQETTMQGWENLTALSAPTGYTITTLAVSRNNPAHVLYYGASDNYYRQFPPKLYRLENAHQAVSVAVDVSVPNVPGSEYGSAYVHSIAVNPEDGNEILVVFSNYNIIGLYYSIDGGQNYMPIEGNLAGGTNNPGPSLRSATILPTTQGTIYVVGTSTGLYSTRQLNGTNTIWKQEGADQLGNVVVEYVTSRQSDSRVAAGTHGRGIFIGTATQSGPQPYTKILEEGFDQDPFPPTGWSIDADDPAHTWKKSNVTGHPFSEIDPQSTFSAVCPYSVNTNQHEWLLSPLFSLDGKNAYVTFYAGYKGTYLYNFTFRLLIRNSQIGLKTLWEAGDNGDEWKWEKITVDLTPYMDQSNLQLVWSYKGKDGDTVAIDGVMLIKLMQTGDLVAEGFDFSPFPPSGWKIDADDPAHTWKQSNVTNHYFSEIDSTSKYSAVCPYSVNTNQHEWLLSPHFSIDGEYAFLSFYAGFKGTRLDNFSYRLFIRNDQIGLKKLWEATDNGTVWKWEKISIDLSDYAGLADLRLIWSYMGKDGDTVALDGVHLTGLVSLHKIDQPEEPSRLIPKEYVLYQNYPNPFNPTTTIRYEIPENKHVKLQIFNMLGERVAELVNEEQPAGRYEIVWNGQDEWNQPVASGVYWYVLTAGKFKKVQRMLLLK